MTNTDKLLHALIDAMGFEIEKVTEPSDLRLVMEHGQQPNNITGYKLTKKEIELDDDLEAVKALMKEFKRGQHEVMTLKYKHKSYTYNDEGVLEIENL